MVSLEYCTSVMSIYDISTNTKIYSTSFTLCLIALFRYAHFFLSTKLRKYIIYCHVSVNLLTLNTWFRQLYFYLSLGKCCEIQLTQPNTIHCDDQFALKFFLFWFFVTYSLICLFWFSACLHYSFSTDAMLSLLLLRLDC